MKEINFNVIRKVKEYPWYFFKKKEEYHTIHIKGEHGFTNINSVNLSDFNYEVDDSEPFYETTYLDYYPGYNIKTLHRKRCYLKDLIFTKFNPRKILNL